MSTIVILISISALILFVFLYFFLLDDDKRILEWLHIIRQSKNDHIQKTPNISMKFFEQGVNDIKFVQQDLLDVKNELHKKIIGMEPLINAILINILAGGHILVEGVPGLAKTKTIHTFADIMDMEFKRIQFTPDMLPSDIVGVEVFNSKDKEFEIKLGPVFANVILADEINRTTPKVQSALLESMQERQVTIGGKTYPLPDPFFVLATQNPIEQEGTYPLPEAQIDRFLFKIIVDYPNSKQEKQVLDTIEKENTIKVKKIISHKEFSNMQNELSKVIIDDSIKHYITRLIQKTRQEHPFIQYGSSPRGSIGLMLAAKALAFVQGRDFVNHEDVQRVSLAVLRHRIILTYDAKIQGITEDSVLLELFKEVELI